MQIQMMSSTRLEICLMFKCNVYPEEDEHVVFHGSGKSVRDQESD